MDFRRNVENTIWETFAPLKTEQNFLMKWNLYNKSTVHAAEMYWHLNVNYKNKFVAD
jgi:hypothetical protein